MTDPTLDALLAAYAGPDWTDGQRLVIADRLEDLGDERAETVQAFEVCEYNDGGISFWHVKPLVQGMNPELDRWDAEIGPTFLTPHRAEEEIRRRVLALFPELSPWRKIEGVKDIVIKALGVPKRLLGEPGNYSSVRHTFPGR